MAKSKHLKRAYKNAHIIPFNKSSKFILMSDCHRGDDSRSDNFTNNHNLFFTALKHYYKNDFTYIELGDGDELWENRDLGRIIASHSNSFWLMSKFYKENRFHMIYGNHDNVKKNCNYCYSKYQNYYDTHKKQFVPLFPDIEIHEGIILKHEEDENEIFLIHGHQDDLLNDTLWKLARFLVRYLWRPLELVGFHDPTSASRKHEGDNEVEKRLIQYCAEEHRMLIAGHTHKTAFPAPGEPMYFNDGSCVHPRCITAIEIENDTITLVKWSVQVRENNSLFIGRKELAGPVPLEKYWEL